MTFYRSVFFPICSVFVLDCFTVFCPMPGFCYIMFYFVVLCSLLIWSFLTNVVLHLFILSIMQCSIFLNFHPNFGYSALLKHSILSWRYLLSCLLRFVSFSKLFNLVLFYIFWCVLFLQSWSIFCYFALFSYLLLFSYLFWFYLFSSF